MSHQRWLAPPLPRQEPKAVIPLCLSGAGTLLEWLVLASLRLAGQWMPALWWLWLFRGGLLVSGVLLLMGLVGGVVYHRYWTGWIAILLSLVSPLWVVLSLVPPGGFISDN